MRLRMQVGTKWILNNGLCAKVIEFHPNSRPWAATCTVAQGVLVMFDKDGRSSISGEYDIAPIVKNAPKKRRDGNIKEEESVETWANAVQSLIETPEGLMEDTAGNIEEVPTTQVDKDGNCAG